MIITRVVIEHFYCIIIIKYVWNNQVYHSNTNINEYYTVIR